MKLKLGKFLRYKVFKYGTSIPLKKERTYGYVLLVYKGNPKSPTQRKFYVISEGSRENRGSLVGRAKIYTKVNNFLS